MTRKEERIKRMKQSYDYCYICQKRNGSWYYDCSPTFVWGRHGNGKPIQSWKRRAFKSWKHNRLTQWKNKNVNM